MHNWCVERTYDAFWLTISDTFDSVVENCGFVIYEPTPQAISADISNPERSIYCAACAPGYTPVYDTAKKIIECVEIANCNRTYQVLKLFNQCALCVEGFTFPFDPVEKVYDYTQCVEEAASDCLVTNPTTQKC